ncbi:hypothetical protein BJ138DRAFT_1103956 [Hygrophoropsis aurantiaca]|uniref:Uncharacterized protein n=1 Tax=Hygrophoropsis aurantiaca TaxID=72124 RepID=A0ACB8A2V5_9AGAM|nr:hypothetical protein BJ138DRAFT_1103956 [Hygrophoropsis aurantiaca]
MFAHSQDIQSYLPQGTIALIKLCPDRFLVTYQVALRLGPRNSEIFQCELVVGLGPQGLPTKSMQQNSLRKPSISSMASTVKHGGRSSRSSNPNTEEDHSRNEVQNADSGKNYLVKVLISQPGVDFTVEHLVSCLHHITALKASSTIADKISSLVIHTLSDQVAKVMLSSEHLTMASKDLDVVRAGMMSANGEAAERLQTSIDGVVVANDDIHTRLIAISAQIDNIPPPPAIPAPSSNSSPSTINSYCDALLGGTQTSVGSPMLARAEAKSRQVLLDPVPGNDTITPTLSHAELVSKLKDALSETVIADLDNDLSPTIKSVTRIRNGGIIVELDSAISAAWLKKHEVRDKFIKTLNSAVSFRDRSYSILIPFVPLIINVELDATLRAIEEENDMEKSSAVSMRWIKPAGRRHPQQRCVHAMLVLSNPDTANRLLRDGVLINSMKLHPRKDKKEPLRCVKCHHWVPMVASTDAYI